MHVITYLPTFFTCILVTSRALHVIPHVSMTRTKSVYAVLPLKVIRLTLRPVTELIWTPIHPSEQSLCSNVIQTDPGLVTIVSVLNIDILLLTFDSGQVSTHASTDCIGFGPCLTSITGVITWTIVETPTWLTHIWVRSRNNESSVWTWKF